MKTFNQFFINELKIARMYHVGPDHLKSGDDLKSLSSQVGIKKAQKQYHKQDKETYGMSGSYSDEHPKAVHFIDGSTVDHKKPIKKGVAGHIPVPKGHTVYDVRPGKHMSPVVHDDDYTENPIVKGHVPSKYIRNKFNKTTKKWDRFHPLKEALGYRRKESSRFTKVLQRVADKMSNIGFNDKKKVPLATTKNPK